jgi:putative DNA primase/helicase
MATPTTNFMGEGLGTQMTTPHEERLQKASKWYAEQGWHLLPCYGINDGGRCTCNGTHTEPKDAGKHAAIGNWNERATTEELIIHNWWQNNPENNIAVVCQKSEMFVIDIDPRSGGLESFDKFMELLGFELPVTCEQYTGSYNTSSGPVRGRHIFLKCSPSEKLVMNLNGSNLPGIDIKHNGYVLLTPSRHFSGTNYEWVEGRAPWEVAVADAPDELLAVLRKGGRGSSSSHGDGDWGWLSDLDSGGERVDIAKMLEDGIDEGERAISIYKLACAIANKFGVETPEKRLMIETMMMRFNYEKVRPPMELEGANSLLMHTRRAMDFVADNPVGFKLFPGLQEWANGTRATATTPSTNQPPNTSDPDDSYSGYSSLPGTIGGEVAEAARSGMSPNDAFSSGNIDVPNDPDAISEAEGGTPGKRSLTDVGNGRRLMDTFGGSIRYTPGIGWFIWDGQYWRPDTEDLGIQELSKRLAPVIASEVRHYDEADKQSEVIKWAQQAKSNGRIRGAVESAKSDLRGFTDVSKWDSDDHLLGVSNGVIDLRTGELLRGRPELYITKRAAVSYTAGLRNARWEQFIDFATGGDKELQDWLQKAIGYTLTGLNNQDLLFLVYGPPGSGKNTFVETIVKALDTNQYAWPMDSNILADNGGMGSSETYTWAELRGRRMVWVDELPDSGRIKENSIKKLTGSSEISARSPGEKPFTFKAQAKLWVTTNHLPQINDEAMWRRIRPIPWIHVPEKADPELKAYLFDPEGALPAVLAWAVEGAVKYLGSSSRDALGWCSAVENAASIYRKNEDRIGMFLQEETVEREGVGTFIKDLYSVYRTWAEDMGMMPLSQPNFAKKLSERGEVLIGHGKTWEILSRTLVLKTVSNPSENGIDWASNVARASRF